MIQETSQSDSERGRDRKFHLSEEAWLTPVLAMTHSFKSCDWLVKKRNTDALFVIMGTEQAVKLTVYSHFIYLLTFIYHAGNFST